MSNLSQISLLVGAVAFAASALAYDKTDASAEVEVDIKGFSADGSSIDGRVELGFAPMDARNAVVRIGDEMLVNTSDAGHWTWFVPTTGTYVVSHAVGDDVISASYVVTNGYAKILEHPNPPMSLVEGVSATFTQGSTPTNFEATASSCKALITISGNGEAWTASTSDGWLTLNSTSGTATGKKIVCTIAENGGVEPRVGYVYVAGCVMTVTQEGSGASLDKTNVSVTSVGGSVTIGVSMDDQSMAWSSWSSSPWISPSPYQGIGSGSVDLMIAPWNNSASRTGTITIAGQCVAVTQAAAQFECSSEMTATVVSRGGSGSFTIATSDGVTWSASSDSDWLVIADDSQLRRGSGAIAWTAETQPALSNRVGTITVSPSAESGFSPYSFVVTQEAASWKLSETNAHVSVRQETVSVDVTVASNVSWSIDDRPDWIVLDGASNRTGSGSVQMTVSANPTSVERSATIKIAGGEFVVTQDAAEFSCPKEEEVSVISGGATGELVVLASEGVTWTVVSDADWLVISGADIARGGSGIIGWKACSQTQLGEARSATITVTPDESSGFKPWTFVVKQDAVQLNVVGGLKRYCLSDGADLSITVRVDVAGIPWTIKIAEDARDDWVLLMSGDESFTGDGMFDLYIDACSDESTLPRSALITIGSQVLEITQVSAEEYSFASYVNLKGASNPNPEVYKEGVGMDLAAPGTVVGYTFAGWTPNAITADMTGPQTVTANWKANSYTIKYDANGGEGTMDATSAVYDSDVEVSANGFTRTGYVFSGWATQKDGAVVYSAGAEVSNLVSEQDGSVTLYAVWKRSPLAIDDLKVTSIEPIGLAIDFTVREATDGDLPRPLEVTMFVGNTYYTAKALSGATNCVNGAHRVYWNMAADGLAASLSNAEIVVRYTTPRYCVIDLSHGTNAASYAVSYYAREPDGGFTNDIYKTTKLVLKRVEAGTFVMDLNQSTASHRVTLSKPFYLALFETTQKQWELVTGTNPCASTKYGKGDDYPVHYVSYDMIRGASEGAKWPATNAVDETSFLGKLRERTNLVLDLPTEAQWEYACRAGTTTKYHYGASANGDYMWYKTNASSSSHAVGTKAANPWGFYDMHGNVREWCRDWTGTLAYGTDPAGLASGTYRVVRDGSWYQTATYCTSAYRSMLKPTLATSYYSGFRLSMSLGAVSDDAEPLCFDDVSASVAGIQCRVAPNESVVISTERAMFVIPPSWFEKYYPNASASERQAIADGAGVKTDASGAGMPVWQDYVAGTDPTNALSKFTAKIEMKDGVPIVTWSPNLNGEGVRGGVRVYRVWGKANLGDAAWSEVGAGEESDYRFFRVTVEMP